MDPIRSFIAVLGGILLISLIVEPLEFTLVNAVAGGQLEDLQDYFDVRNRPGLLAAKLVYNTLAAVLGGYMTAKIAPVAALWHAGTGALLQTLALVWGFTAAEYAAFTPVWMRIALVLVTGPAMMGGAIIQTRAAQLAPDGGTASETGEQS